MKSTTTSFETINESTNYLEMGASLLQRVQVYVLVQLVLLEELKEHVQILFVGVEVEIERADVVEDLDVAGVENAGIGGDIEE